MEFFHVVGGGMWTTLDLFLGFVIGPVLRKMPLALLAGAVALAAGSVAALSRVRYFAWPTFFLVARWALLAYLVIAGMIEYVFVLDHTPGGPLAVLALMLVVYAVAIPVLLAFSVARYQTAPAVRP